jgi:hypothetical protein
MATERQRCGSSLGRAAPDVTVAVLMTGNIWSLENFRDVVMPSVQHSFLCPGYDTFLVTSDRVYLRSPPEYLTEEMLNSTGTFATVQLVSWEEYKLPKDKAAKRCDHFKPPRMNHVGLLQQFLKFPVAYASMQARENARGHSYDFVVRTRPDIKILESLPHVRHLFHQLRRPNGNKNMSTHPSDFSGLVASRAVANAGVPVADIVVWDDQFAMMMRSSASDFFNLVPQAYMMCHAAETWARACGLTMQEAVESVQAKRIPCCPLRTIAVIGNTVVRDCGSVRAEHCFERTVMTAWGSDHRNVTPTDLY